MQHKIARRWLAGLGAAGAFVAATGMPALAEAPAPTIAVYQPDTTVAVDTEGKIESPILYGSEPLVLTGATIAYDFGNLDGVAEVAAAEDITPECDSPSAGQLVCTDPFEIGVDEWGGTGSFAVVIKAAAGAETGDSGKLKVTFSADGFDAVSHTATVRVGEGVDLAAGPETEVSGKPGTAFTNSLKLRNAGGTAADGAVALFFNDYGIHAEKRHSNCTYEGAELRTCHFDAELLPERSYDASLAYRIAADAYAPGTEWGEIYWMTPAEYEDFAAYLSHLGASPGTHGDGAVLELAEAGGGAARSRRTQVDTDPDNNATVLTVNVTGKNGADLVALGDTLTGSAGDVVTATVGLKNEGPATLDSNRGGEPLTRIDVRIPTGTTVVTVPPNCTPLKGNDVDPDQLGQPGADAYRCWSSTLIKVGTSETVEFGLRIDKVVPDATGTVAINVKCLCTGMQGDLDPTNDKAKIVVNPSGGSAGGDEGLPITGTAITSLIAAGVALLMVGIVGFVVVRRRRVRFIA